MTSMLAGTEIGEFVIVRPLARGGMGAVFVARQRNTGALRALKVLHPSLSSDARLTARFEQEARVGALIPSDHVVEVVAAGLTPQGDAWLAMELLEGKDLATYIDERVRLAAAEVAEILAQVGHALSAAHGVGIVHRDLKPENVFLANRRMVGVPYVVKLLDFGVAKLVSESSHATAALGTPMYMPPEQAGGRGDISHLADVWSFGLLAFEMLVGVPFWRAGRAGDFARVFREILLDPIPTASERAAEELAPDVLPYGFDAWFARCVSRQPEDRFASVALAVGALESLLHVSPTSVRPALHSSPVPAGARAPTATEEAPTLTSSRDGSVGFSGSSRPPRRPIRLVYRERFGRTVVSANAGDSLLEVSLANDVPHHRVCGGRARCSTCRVMVHDGHELLEPRGEPELHVARSRRWGPEIRLACQARIRNDATGEIVVRRLVIDRQDSEDAQSGSGETERLVERRALVLVARVEGLTSFAARHLPYDAMHIASRVFGTLGELVRAHRGEVVSMQGSRLTAIFAAEPGHVERAANDALRAAFRMGPRLAIVNEYIGQNFGESFSVTVGLHVGTVFLGSTGTMSGSSGAILIGETSEVSERIASSLVSTSMSVAATDEAIACASDDVAMSEVIEVIEGPNVHVRALYGFAKPDVNFLVQSSFESIVPVADDFARRFYARLFELAPDTRQMFAYVDMDVQRKMLIDVLAAAIRGLDDLPALLPTLEALGRRHVGYGVAVSHYRAVGTSLLETLAAQFGDAFTPEVHLAWMEIYGVLARTMIEASRSDSRVA